MTAYQMRISDWSSDVCSSDLSLGSLCDDLNDRGFRTTSGKRITVTQLHKLLHNPFYAGLIVVGRTGETYPGIHQPLISMHLFQATQRTLRGKANDKAVTHDFLFRRMVRCQPRSEEHTSELQSLMRISYA